MNCVVCMKSKFSKKYILALRSNRAVAVTLNCMNFFSGIQLTATTTTKAKNV